MGRTRSILKPFVAAVISSDFISLLRKSIFSAKVMQPRLRGLVLKSPRNLKKPNPKAGKDQPYRAPFPEGRGDVAAEDAAPLGLCGGPPRALVLHHTSPMKGLEASSPAGEKPRPGTRIHQGTQEKTRRSAITIFICPDDNRRALRARPHLRMSHDSDAILCPLLQGLQ